MVILDHCLRQRVDPAKLLAHRLGNVLGGLATTAEPVAASVLRDVLTVLGHGVVQ